MSHSQDLEAPTIFVEAPPEDEQDLIDSTYPSHSLNSNFQDDHSEVHEFLRMFSETSSSAMSMPGVPSSGQQSLVSASFDPSHSIGSIPPLITAALREGSAGNVFLAPIDQSSPVDPAWSPASSYEGDAFPDAWSDGSSNWSPSVQSSSPSSPSLSPLNTSFNNIVLSDDNVSGPTLYRQRSNSYTGNTESLNDLSLRTRAASFTDVSSLAQPTADDLSLFQNFSVESAPQNSQWTTSVQSDAANNAMNGTFDPSAFNPSLDDSNWNIHPTYSPPVGPPPFHTHGMHGRSHSTHLTVPGQSLQRRDAHRRSHSHTGIQQDSVRGRKRFSPTGDLSSRHSSHSRDASPVSPYAQLDFPNPAAYLNFGPTVNTLNSSDPSSLLPSASSPQSEFLSPTSTSSNSPQSPSGHFDLFSPTTSSPQSLSGPVDTFLSPGISSSSSSSRSSLPITIQGNESEPELIPVQYSGGVARRHSFAGNRSPSGSRSGSPLPENSTGASVHRAISDPIGQNRRRRAPNVPRKYPGLLKPAKEVDEAGPSRPDSSIMMNVAIEGVHSAPPAAEFKTVVGSDKIVQASVARRKNEAKFKCELCDHRFTAKHNLQSVHIFVRNVGIRSRLEGLMLVMNPIAPAAQYGSDSRGLLQQGRQTNLMCYVINRFLQLTMFPLDRT
ncbi:hypothetical protein EV360DRAFT_66789 [Lentinula raphanica]|nr:hypothetical protein EV360DRAFT_66789 [Lentinula raphanica]